MTKETVASLSEKVDFIHERLHLGITTPGIGGALLHVFERVGYVQKSGQMGHGERYTYAGEADFIRAIRPLLAEAGIVGPIPIKTDRITVEHAPTKRGARQFRTEVTVTYRFLHGPTGEFHDVQVAAEGIDVGDKGTAKAMTGAYKYVLRQTFCIETGDDPDETSSGDQESVVSPEDQEHDDEWGGDRSRFCAKLRELGMEYSMVREWALKTHNCKPSTWGRQGRRSFMRDLINNQIPDLYQSEGGASA